MLLTPDWAVIIAVFGFTLMFGNTR